MKNIVFIGPYRQYDYIGMESSLYLDAIGSYLSKVNYRTYARPLIIDDSITHQDPSLNHQLHQYEQLPQSTKECAAIIQHCPIEHLAIQKKWKNICIPILDPRLHKASVFSYIQKLNYVDNIIVHNESQKNFLLKSNIKTNITVCEDNLIQNLNNDILSKKYDFGPLYNSLYNFGFIGSYAENVSVIQRIIISYIYAYRQDSKTRLILFLRGTQNDKMALEKLYASITRDLNVKNFNNNIIFLFNNLDISASIIALNSINCLLSLNDDYQYSLYETFLNTANKSVISKNNIDVVPVPPSLLNKYDMEDIIGSISTNSLSQKMSTIQSVVSNHKNKKTKHNIGETICHILQ